MYTVAFALIGLVFLGILSANIPKHIRSRFADNVCIFGLFCCIIAIVLTWGA